MRTRAFRCLAAVAGLILAIAWTGCATTRPAPSVRGPVPPAEAAQPGPAPGEEVEAQPEGVHHVVLRGQTMWRIARSYGVPLDDLARVNGIADPASVAAGTVLFIPGAHAPIDVPTVATSLDPIPSDGPAVTSSRTWHWPVAGGELLSAFGAPRRHGRQHEGIDIRAAKGQDVVAVAAGRVIYCGERMRGYGKTVILDHGDGLTSLYAHNSELLVHEGETVEVGQILAHAGKTGNASGAHCHLEIRRRNVAIDPLSFLAVALGSVR